MTHQLHILTNSYAGNFEREMTAFLTGHIGDCEVGKEFIDPSIQKQFENKISYQPDRHGTFRPVTLAKNSNNFIIFLEDKLTTEDLNLIDSRAKLFEETKPYTYLNENFKYLGLKQYKYTKTETLTEI